MTRAAVADPWSLAAWSLATCLTLVLRSAHFDLEKKNDLMLVSVVTWVYAHGLQAQYAAALGQRFIRPVKIRGIFRVRSMEALRG